MALSKAKIKFLASLKQKKFREIENRFLIEGEKILSECIHSDWEIIEVFLSNEVVKKNSQFVELIKSKKIPITIIPAKEFEKFSSDKTPSQIAALVERKQFLEDEVFNLSSKKFLILQNISDPGNFGTIIRSADWFGINGIICDESTVELTNPKVVKGSMGSIFHLLILHNVHLLSFCEKLKSSGMKIISTSTTGKDLSQFDFSENCAVIFGNESVGISEQINKIADETIAIPKFGKAESLNVSIAASIILYEWTRKFS